MIYYTGIITDEMLEEANKIIPKTKVNRTIASKNDTLVGHIGEYIFAEFYYFDWTKNSVGNNKGKIDFDDIEIKTSAFPYNENLNLLVREDYAKKRKPSFYVQIIIDVPSKNYEEIKAGTKVYICGCATHKQVDEAPLKDFGSKFGGNGGYRCHYIPISKLEPIQALLNFKLKK